MKFNFYIICLFLIFKNITLIAQSNKFLKTNFYTPSQKSEFYLYIAKTYNSNALAILNYKNSDNFTKWSNGNSHYTILNSYGNVIHETCHSVNEDIGWLFNMGFYISPKIKISVSKTAVFRSSEIDKNIPEKWKKDIFRYKTYIQGVDNSDEISSIVNGIYGLMDEFDAYYQGTRAVVELFEYYKTFANYSEPYYWTIYLSNCYSTIFANYEFNLFIAWYLKYAKTNYPDIYTLILNNKNLKVVYTLINNGYQKVIEKYYMNRKNIIDNINKTGKKKAVLTDKYLYITTTKNNHSCIRYEIPDREITYLKSLYTIEDYQMLTLLTIDRLNEENYKTYLK
jgi:hypothetical protein